jgi:hypothetical protein
MKKALIITWERFQDHELVYPYYSLKENEFEVTLMANKVGRIYGDMGCHMPCDVTTNIFEDENIRKQYLNEYDACGVDLVDTPQIHFSGNFWWSNSEYIKTLPTIHDLKYKIKPVLSVRHNCEFWIGMGGGRLKSLWDSNINVYERHLHRYSNSEYIKCL